MAYLLILLFSGSFITKSGEKRLVYSTYSFITSDGAFLYYRSAYNGAYLVYINIIDSGALKAAN